MADARVETTLDDGTRLLFRLIRPDDKAMLLNAFHRLSGESNYMRFFSQLKSLSPRQLQYLTEVDHENHSAWVAIALGDEPTGIGVARWVRLPEEPKAAEIAATVVDDYQRRGIGRTLLFLCALGAQSKGIEEFRAWILADNDPAFRMLAGIDAVRRRPQGGIVEVSIPVTEIVARAEAVPLALTERPR